MESSRYAHLPSEFARESNSVQRPNLTNEEENSRRQAVEDLGGARRAEVFSKFDIQDAPSLGQREVALLEVHKQDMQRRLIPQSELEENRPFLSRWKQISAELADDDPEASAQPDLSILPGQSHRLRLHTELHGSLRAIGDGRGGDVRTIVGFRSSPAPQPLQASTPSLPEVIRNAAGHPQLYQPELAKTVERFAPAGTSKNRGNQRLDPQLQSRKEAGNQSRYDPGPKKLLHAGNRVIKSQRIPASQKGASLVNNKQQLVLPQVKLPFAPQVKLPAGKDVASGSSQRIASGNRAMPRRAFDPNRLATPKHFFNLQPALKLKIAGENESTLNIVDKQTFLDRADANSCNDGSVGNIDFKSSQEAVNLIEIEGEDVHMRDAPSPSLKSDSAQELDGLDLSENSFSPPGAEQLEVQVCFAKPGIDDLNRSKGTRSAKNTKPAYVVNTNLPQHVSNTVDVTGTASDDDLFYDAAEEIEDISGKKGQIGRVSNVSTFRKSLGSVEHASNGLTSTSKHPKPMMRSMWATQPLEATEANASKRFANHFIPHTRDYKPVHHQSKSSKIFSTANGHDTHTEPDPVDKINGKIMAMSLDPISSPVQNTSRRGAIYSTASSSILGSSNYARESKIHPPENPGSAALEAPEKSVLSPIKTVPAISDSIFSMANSVDLARGGSILGSAGYAGYHHLKMPVERAAGASVLGSSRYAHQRETPEPAVLRETKPEIIASVVIPTDQAPRASILGSASYARDHGTRNWEGAENARFSAQSRQGEPAKAGKKALQQLQGSRWAV